MTDPLEAARAYVAAGDALKSPEHAADVEKLRELSNRVHEREQAYQDAHSALIACHIKQVESAELEPAPNEEAARTIASPKPWVEQFLNGDHPALSAEDDIFEPEQPFHSFGGEVPEEATARANGAYSED